MLARIGQHLEPQELKVSVRLPGELAECALEAWDRDDNDGPLPAETADEWIMRDRAASLSLIGLQLSEQRVSPRGDEVVAHLSAHLVGAALDAHWDERPPGCGRTD